MFNSLWRALGLNIAKDSRPVNLHVTLWPAFAHFRRFAHDKRLQGIRLNSAMMEASEIDTRFAMAHRTSQVPLWFDVKGMQMRVREVVPSDDHLEFILNRPVKVKTPCTVWFKAGEDRGKCVEIKDDTHFIFDGGPRFVVKPGESIHILEDDLEVGGEPFLPYERTRSTSARPSASTAGVSVTFTISGMWTSSGR